MAGDAWWSGAVVYEIYVRSFADSTGDGVGDLRGIMRRLDEVAELGVDAVWLTPFYRSPMADGGYDVADPCDVDPMFGTLADFDALLSRAHALGLRVVVDVVPNHLSSSHPWFVAATSDRQSELRDRFFFRDQGPDGALPNNWPSEFGGPAWELEPSGEQVYLHLFAPEQPDVNWRHPAVRTLFDEVLTFWSDRGVDGFRIDVAHGLIKAAGLPDIPPPVPASLTGLTDLPFVNQPEVHEVYRGWRALLPPDRLLVGEVYLYDSALVATYVGAGKLSQAFDFTMSLQPFEAAALGETILGALRAFEASGVLPTWVLCNHDLIRTATRWGGGVAGRERALAGLALVLGLPGSPYLFQGDELALEQSDVAAADRQDPIWARSGHTEVGRDGVRTPMPWTSGSPGYGFTTGTPWLPLDPAVTEGQDVAAQRGDSRSPRSTVAALLGLRRERGTRLGPSVLRRDSPAGILWLSRAGVGDCAGLEILVNTTDADVAVTGCDGPVLLATRGAAQSEEGLTVAARSTVWVESVAAPTQGG